MYISPTTAEHVRESLGNKVAAILNGGPCEVGLESTVLSLLGEQPTILRPGAITRDILENILGCQVATSQSAQTADSSPLLSPGMLAKHYSPYTPVILLNSLSPYPSTPQRTGAVLFANHTQLSFSPFVTKVISETGDPAEIAARLFAALRELDSMNLELIVVDTCEPVGLGAAIMDRLVRAAHPKS
jgi:L-threonylcarbamoyladenylate synthase